VGKVEETVPKGISCTEKDASTPIHDDLAYALADIAKVEAAGARDRPNEELEQERRKFLCCGISQEDSWVDRYNWLW
jgi:hypothetical protein